MFFSVSKIALRISSARFVRILRRRGLCLVYEGGDGGVRPDDGEAYALPCSDSGYSAVELWEGCDGFART